MKLLSPLLKYTLTQGFGSNGTPLYGQQGLLGHPGADLTSFWGDIINSSVDCKVYNILNKKDPDLMKYRAVLTLFQDKGQWYELTYGHMHDIIVSVGDVISAGTPIGTEGNTGEVYYAGSLVTREQKNSGIHWGAHIHYQLRKITRVAQLENILVNRYLSGSDGNYYKDENGYCLVPDFNNGYNGCVDPVPSLFSPSLTSWLEILKAVLAKLKGRA